MQRNMSNRRGTNGTYSAYDRRIDEANRTLLERENDEHWAELGRSAAMLKSVSMEINQEVNAQNDLISKMNAQFHNAGQMFDQTIGKLGNMLQSGSGKHMLYLIAFVIFAFILIYFIMTSKS